MADIDDPIDNPTWYEHVRYFFEQEDIEHMGQLGLDLATYDGVRNSASSIFFQTLPPNGRMPPDPARKWSQERSDNFRKWIEQGFALGTPTPDPVDPEEPEGPDDPDSPDSALRLRQDIRNVKGDDLEKLKLAFETVMGREPDDPNSYFFHAANHWLPSPLFCLHHENRYNPWHRAYLFQFENALRSVDGCEDVTLPFWDITQSIPNVLFDTPFEHYTLPVDVGSGFIAGYQTERFNRNFIRQRFQDMNINGDIATAIGQSQWEGFDHWISRAHDSGHVSIGPSMSMQEVAAYDPIFWFFHCNWDRLWWKWQKSMDATNLTKFKSTLSGSPFWLDAPFHEIPPFTDTADQTIDSIGQYNVDYDQPSTDADVRISNQRGSASAQRQVGLSSPKEVSVRVKGINRLSIPGSFIVHLMKDGTPIASNGFFQPQNPNSCETCKKNGEAHFDFLLPLKAIEKGKLTVGIEMTRPDRVGRWFPLTNAGNPTINVRLLLKDE